MKIKEIRERLGLSQRELARNLGLFPQAISRYESGTGEPNIETLIKIADFFNVSIDELVGRETEAVNLKPLDETRKELVRAIINGSNAVVDRLDAFYQGVKYAEEERQATIEEIKKRRGK